MSPADVCAHGGVRSRWLPKYGFDKKTEVLEGHALEWIHAESLVGVCHVERCSAAVFNNKLECGKLPSSIPCYFTREPAPEPLERLAVEGVFLPNSRNADHLSPSKFVAPSEALGGSTRRRRGRGRTARARAGARTASPSTLSTSPAHRPHTTGAALGRSRSRRTNSPKRESRSRTRGSAKKGRSGSPNAGAAGAGSSTARRSDLEDGSFASSLKLPVMGPGNLSMYKR